MKILDVSERSKRSGMATRVFAFATLGALVSGVAYVGQQARLALTDSLIAPIILTPDNDLVVQNKVKMAELYLERGKADAELEGIDAELAGCEHAITQLEALKKTIENALHWTTEINAGQVDVGAADRKTLVRQRDVIAGMIDKQEHLTRDARANLDAGLLSRTDYAKEMQSLNQMQVALLENQRAKLQTDLQLRQVTLTQKTLRSGGGSAPLPEMVLREDQLVRVELELLKTEAERRTKLVAKRVVSEKIAKLEELEGQLRGRPIFRAVEKSMDIAFVPYTQLRGLAAGFDVYDCVWGVFRCRQVGTLAEIVPGEVMAPDPWGTPTRGQYAVLTLRDHESAKSKTLRIRKGTQHQVAAGTGLVAVK